MPDLRRLYNRKRRVLGLLLLNALVLLLVIGCTTPGVYHQVKPGQTLYRISKTYNVDEAYLARINGVSNPTQLRVGTRIYVPGVDRVRYVPATVPSKSAKKVVTSVTRKTPPKVSSKVKTSKKSTAKASSSLKRTKKSTAKVGIKLRWPLRGKILRSFGSSGKGAGKGLEIAAREGSKVSAAAAGKVIYSGDGVQGFGHLMILQHENDVFTVYGFNAANHVKQGQFISQGEKIASSGRPPSGGSGRLHFEVRIGKKAVDPILYLP